MDTIKQFFDLMPALMNFGDETRGVTLNHLPKKTIKKINKNAIYPGSIPIRVSFLDSCITMWVVPDGSTTEFIDQVLNWASNKTPYIADKDMYICQGPSILKPGFKMSDYNVQHNMNFIVNCGVLKGGSKSQILLPTYNIVEECEEKILSEVFEFTELQSSSFSIDDECLSFLEDISLLMNNIYHSKSVFGVIGNIIMFLKLRIAEGKSLASKSLDFIQEYLEKLLEIGSLQIQADDEDILETIKLCWTNFSKFKDTKFVKSILKMVALAITVPILWSKDKRFDLKKFEFLFEKGLFGLLGKSADLAAFLFEMFSYIAKKGYQVYCTGSLDTVLIDTDQFGLWYDDYSKLIMWSKLISDPESHGFNIFEYETLLDDTIEKGKNTIKYVLSEKKKERLQFSALVNNLCLLKAELCTKKIAQQQRQAPCSFLVYGNSSIGKSSFLHMLFAHYGKLFKLPIGSEYIYTRNPSDDYWSGFTSNQWGVLLDDIGYLRPDKAPNGDPSLLEMLQVINNVPFSPNQAELEAKGKTPLRARLVLASSNTIDLNAHAYFACPLAIRRRLPFVIEIAIKPEYATNNMLDPSKLPIVEDGDYPNFWLLTIHKVAPAEKNRARLEKIAEFSDINKFIVWYSQTCLHHEKIQKQAMKANTNIEHVEICDTCFNTKKNCSCLQIQSQEIFQKVIYNFVVWQIKGYGYLILSYIYVFIYYICNFLGFRKFNKELFMNSMKDVSKQFNKNNLLKGLTVAVGCGGVLMILYKLFKQPKKDIPIQGAEISAIRIGKKPQPKEQERENAWVQREVEISGLDFGPQTLSLKGQRSQIQDWMKMNTVALVLEYEREGIQRKVVQHAVCLYGHTYVANSHGIPLIDNVKFTIIQSSVTKNVTLNTEMVRDCTNLSFVRFPEKDLVFFEITVIPPKRDITGLLTERPLSGCHNGFLVSKGLHGIPTIRDIKAIKLASPHLAHLGDKLAYLGYTNQPTENGDCGSPLLIENGYGISFIGIHVAGRDDIVAAMPISRSDINEYRKGLRVQSGVPMLSSETVKRELGPLHQKSTLNWIDKGTCAVYGTFLGFKAHKRSNVGPTLIRESAMRHGFEDKCDKPLMTSYIPWRHASLEMVNPANGFNLEILQQAADMYFKEVMSCLDKNTLDEIHPYDLNTVVNGAPGVAFVDKMNRKTSTGCPWKTTKEKFLQPMVTEEYPNGVKFTSEIIDRVDIMLRNYQQGIRAHPIFCGNLKDEALPIEKCREGKTRVFAGAPVDWSICVRTYFLSLIRAMQNNQEVFECAVGITAQSTAWTRLYKYITRFGENRIFEGDYKKYDKRMPSSVILMAFNVLIKIAKESGNYTETDILAMYTIAEDTAFPWMDFDGDLIEFFGSNPSGHPLTVIINCIVNSIYMRYCFILSAKDNRHTCQIARKAPLFKNYVSLMTYGDDNIASVSRSIDWFNHTSIQKQLAAVGVTYTMADKTSESVPFVSIKTSQFLKRGWRWEPELDAYACPLDESSIHKMLTKTVISKSVTPEFQSCAILDTACREYFWYGKEIFNKKRNIFKMIVEEHDLGKYAWEGFLPSWENLVMAFRENSDKLVPAWSLNYDQDIKCD